MQLEDFLMTGWKNGGAVSSCPKLVQKAEELAPDLVRTHPRYGRQVRLKCVPAVEGRVHVLQADAELKSWTYDGKDGHSLVLTRVRHQAPRCTVCGLPLQPIGYARKNGKRHRDWMSRTEHKKCFLATTR
eukprot:COSAG04_NODE_780_length_10315_cov_3.685033_7_plen_130_part_00